MTSIQAALFDLLVNAVLQIGFLAVLAAIFWGLIAKARAKHQHSLYLAMLLFSLAVPIVNTFWYSSSSVVQGNPQLPAVSDGGAVNHASWTWRERSGRQRLRAIPPELKSWTVDIWGVLVLFWLVRFSLATCQVRRLRREASALSFARIRMACGTAGVDRRVALLESDAIGAPVTIGVFRPAILLPTGVLPQLDERDLAAVVAHEYGHIRRGDFAIQMLCRLISLPVAWHPGIQYLISKISQTREIACDHYAAACLGERRSYASALLRLASLCLPDPRRDAMALGIFEGDNLETRIMMLTKKTTSLSRAGLLGLVLTASITFGAGGVLTRAMSLQAETDSSHTPDQFAGTWHWMFDGRSFATMVLVRDGSGFKGSVTGSRVALNGDGTLSQADPSEDTTPKRIARSSVEASALRITVADGFQFTVTLKDGTHAEILPVGAPPRMKPIAAVRVN